MLSTTLEKTSVPHPSKCEASAAKPKLTLGPTALSQHELLCRLSLVEACGSPEICFRTYIKQAVTRVSASGSTAKHLPSMALSALHVTEHFVAKC